MLRGKKDTQNGSETTSLIALGMHIRGDVLFNGRLHVDGKIEGSIQGETSSCVLTLSNHAIVNGAIQVSNIVINGSINGDVTASERLELASGARIEGNVYYKVLEMSAGARINGKIVHQPDPKQLSGPAPVALAEPELAS
ncbi:MAG TPA: polymer-forming cytoskeletal protein [Rudaea sp.]